MFSGCVVVLLLDLYLGAGLLMERPLIVGTVDGFARVVGPYLRLYARAPAHKYYYGSKRQEVEYVPSIFHAMKILICKDTLFSLNRPKKVLFCCQYVGFLTLFFLIPPL